LYAPAGTPKPIVLGINRIVTDSLRTPETMKRLAMEGTEPSDPMTPDEFKAAITKEYVLVEKLVKQINIKLF
jgi:tripartite-type tricarboxylate transporter receptor subunit TctC